MPLSKLLRKDGGMYEVVCDCGNVVARVRQAQRYCSKRCRDNAAQQRRRNPSRSADKHSTLTTTHVSALTDSTPYPGAPQQPSDAHIRYWRHRGDRRQAIRVCRAGSGRLRVDRDRRMTLLDQFKLPRTAQQAWSIPALDSGAAPHLLDELLVGFTEVETCVPALAD
jgi:hypothetical protein